MLRGTAAAIAASVLCIPTYDALDKKKSSGTVSIKCRDGSTVLPYSVPDRDSMIQKMKEESFDVLVIGGGCVGAGVALDAQNRGLKTALVERDDFAAGTSSRSTKLIHGGVRYLEQAVFQLDWGLYKLVEEALAERKHMLASAPYMNHPLPIMIPIYEWWKIPYYWAGSKAYDLLAGNSGVPPSSFITKSEALFEFPSLKEKGLCGAMVYFDGQMNDARLALIIALTATQKGASLANRVEVVRVLQEEGKVCGALVRDTLSGEEWKVRARCVINATGAFTDAVRALDADEQQQQKQQPKQKPAELVVPAGGVHMMLPDHCCPQRMGLLVPKTKDGRVLFYLPWEGATLCGTTDTKSPLTMLPRPSGQEVDFILEESNRYLSTQLSREDVLAAWSGIRPLVRDPKYMQTAADKGAAGGTNTSKLSREHVVDVSGSGMVTITGGKWTTYRKMAEDAVEASLRAVPELTSATAYDAAAASTLGMTLLGSDRVGEVCGQKFNRITVTLREDYEMEKDVAEHLVRNYGTRAIQVAEIARAEFAKQKGGSAAVSTSPRLSRKYPFVEAEVLFAVRQELAVRAVDVLARRTRLAFVDCAAAHQAVPRVVQLMAKELGWSAERQAEETKLAEEFLATMRV